jgi:hypothetical protein
MDFIKETWAELRKMSVRQTLGQFIQLGAPSGPLASPAGFYQSSMPLSNVSVARLALLSTRGTAPAGLIMTSALMIWKSLMLVTGSDSPVRCRPTAALRS